MEYLKDKDLVTPEYVVKLRAHLLENQETFFAKTNRADSWLDFDRFPTMLTDREHLCMYNEPMLIDRSDKGVHTYCICTISNTGKVTMQVPVIAIDDMRPECWRNGYFLLPVL